MGDHPLPPDVLSPNPIAFIKLESNQRSSNLFARMQQEMRQLLASHNSQPLSLIPRKACPPLSWPSHRNNDSSSGPRDIKVRPFTVGRPSPHRTKLLHRPGPKRGFKGFKIRRRRRTALVVMKNKLPVVVALEFSVQRFDIFKDGCVGSPSILEIQRPFYGREILVRHRMTLDL